jgi:hypothetical protein
LSPKTGATEEWNQDEWSASETSTD